MARPKSVISPILFGLGVELHHQYGSEWLIRHLNTLGFSVSYDEVGRLRKSVVLDQSLEKLSPPAFPVLSRYGGDNIDDKTHQNTDRAWNFSRHGTLCLAQKGRQRPKSDILSEENAACKSGSTT